MEVHAFAWRPMLRRDITALHVVMKTPFYLQFYGSAFTTQTEDGDGREDSEL
jgi:hypothetical protein